MDRRPHIIDGSIITSAEPGKYTVDASAGYGITAANLAPAYPICIYGKDGTMLAAVKADGSIEYGPNYTPDEAARTFWEAMGAGWLGFLAPLVKREVEAKHAALIAENARLRTALTQLMRHFPTDTDMAEAGWAQHEINEACDAHDAARSALSDNPATNGDQP